MKTLTSTFLFILLFAITGPELLAQRAKDGSKTVSSANTVVNEYTPLISNAVAGTTVINVASSSLNGSNYFSAGLSAGDLVYIIQMQGATITTPDDSTYGTISSYGNCGNNEFAEVLSVPTNTSIELTCGLQHDYTAAGKVQVVRVPRYSTLAINSGGVLTSAAWNGTTGGVLVVEVLGNTTLATGGKIDVTGNGFRGGALDNTSQFGTGNYVWNNAVSGAEKGEGIGGSQADYDLIGGRYDRGAPANGGGGGNGHNSGAGGGANAGNISGWNGWGNPDNSNVNYTTAWNLEYMGFANNVSSGGGRGGYDYSANRNNPLTTPPGNSAWGGDNRHNNGGMGGRPLDYSTGRLFMGGGGGAGDENQGFGTAGANGGGLVYILSYANVNGSGQIIANGATVPNTNLRATDGCGGAGGGGTVIVNAQGSVSSVSINADGGRGGNQVIYNLFLDPDEAEGPGGGGGGGYVAISSGAPVRTAAGGNNGTTDSGSMPNFPPNGATKGAAGLPNEVVTNYWPVAIDDTICNGSTTTLTVTIGGTVPGGVTAYWYSSLTGGTPLGSGTSFTTPSLSSNTTYYVGLCPGVYRIPVNVVVGAVTASFTANNTCPGDTVHFNNTSTGATSWSWNFGDNTTSTASNPWHVYASSNTYTVTLVVSNGSCSDSITHTVVVSPAAAPSFTVNATSACDSLTVLFNNTTTGATSYSWDFGDGGSSTSANPSHLYNTPGTYSVTLTASSGNCTSSVTQSNLITIYETPQAIINADRTFVCLGTCDDFTSTSTGSPTSWSWTFQGATPTTSTAQNPTNICYQNGGTYSVSLTVSNAHCSSSQTLPTYIIVDECAAPHSSFFSSDTVLCGTGCVDFTNTTLNALSFQWFFPGANPSSSTATSPSNICYSSTGTYNVTLISHNNFSNDTLIVNQFIQIVTPTVPTFSQSGNMLTSSPATSYQWYFNGSAITGATNQQYVAATTGNYYVVTTDANGCTATSSTSYITVSGISEIAPGTVVYFYPNPFSKSLELLIETSYSGNAKLKMTDAIGKLIFEKDIKIQGRFQTTFDFSDLANGVYFMAIETDKATTVRKIVKNN